MVEALRVRQSGGTEQIRPKDGVFPVPQYMNRAADQGIGVGPPQAHPARNRSGRR